MNALASSSRIVLLPATAPATAGTAEQPTIRRYRLARLAVPARRGHPLDREHLKRMYD